MIGAQGAKLPYWGWMSLEMPFPFAVCGSKALESDYLIEYPYLIHAELAGQALQIQVRVVTGSVISKKLRLAED